MSQVLASREEALARIRRTIRGLGSAHWLAPAFFALIALPIIVQVLAPPRRSFENRALATAPALPRSFPELSHFPSAVDAWLNDRFGLRRQLVETNNWLRYRLFAEIGSRRLTPGRNGRLFMGAHDGWPDNSLIFTFRGAPMPPAVIERAAASAALVLSEARAAFPDARLMLVPTAGRLYPEDIPNNLAATCRSAKPAGDRIVTRLKAGPDGAALIYPLELMLALKSHLPVIPRARFHWAGEAALRVAETISEQEFGLKNALSCRLSRTTDLRSWRCCARGLACTIGS